MDIIKSKDNAIIKEVKKLNNKKYRIQQKEFLVEGIRFVCEAVKSFFNIKYIFVSEECNEKYMKLLENCNISNVELITVSQHIMNYISSTVNSQGVLAVVNNRDFNIDNTGRFYVLVDKVQDPGNLGTIIRTAHAAGAAGVIATKGTVDAFNDKTLRSTMGSIFHVPFINDYDLSFIKELKKNGYKILASYLDNTSKNIYDINLRGKLIITIGNEGNGISDNILKLADIKVKIPMPGGTESLNASVAASVIMYEMLRQNLIC